MEDDVRQRGAEMMGSAQRPLCLLRIWNEY